MIRHDLWRIPLITYHYSACPLLLPVAGDGGHEF